MVTSPLGFQLPLDPADVGEVHALTPSTAEAAAAVSATEFF
ncbi:MAG: hypothetical protein ACRDOY_12775 [Nocardioidaceae bacterium]